MGTVRMGVNGRGLHKEFDEWAGGVSVSARG